MVQTIDWTPTARATFDQIIDFLLHQWNEEIAARFAQLVEEKIVTLRYHPEIGVISDDSSLRKVLIPPCVVLYYDYLSNQNVIKLRAFWDTRQDPDKLKPPITIMPHYFTLGRIPHKRHTQFRRPDGKLYSEQLFSTEGFSDEYTLPLSYKSADADRSHRRAYGCIAEGGAR